MLLFAHRGKGFGARENTLEAFRRVAASEIYGVELDVRLTADLVPVIHHDPSMVFRGKRHRISALPFRTPGFPLPTLYDACSILLPHHGVIVEVKPGPRELAPIVEVLSLWKKDQEQLWISSFDPLVLQGFRNALPWLRRTLLVPPRVTSTEVEELARTLEVEGIHLHMRQLKRFPVEQWRREGYRIRAYTINTIGDARTALVLGSHDLMSDRPRSLLRLREEGAGNPPQADPP